MTRLPRLLALAAAGLVVGTTHAGGLDIHADASAADVGLPAYPGAVKEANKGGEPAGFSFGIWGDSFGFKLAVVGFESTDDVEPVAAFYRAALGHYGPVVECTRVKGQGEKPPSPPPEDGAKKSSASKAVTCDRDDAVEPGGRLFKVGTKGSQRVFKARPLAKGGTHFELVRIDARGED